MGYDEPIFQDDKPVNMFEAILPLAMSGVQTLAPSVVGTKPGLGWD